jgi:hypothetical protein
MTKPKKIIVKYIASNQKAVVRKDDDIRKAVEAKQATADDACPFC